jgi:hypothetical protein
MEPGYIHGRIDIGHTSLHLEMVQVMDDETEDGPAQVTCGSDVNNDRYESLMHVHSGDGKGYETISWDGRDWVIYIFPFAR